MNNLRLILYYTDLICEKIDLQVEAAVLRIEALIAGDQEKVEFIEHMMLEPLEKQIAYLAGKASKLCERKNKYGYQ